MEKDIKKAMEDLRKLKAEMGETDSLIGELIVLVTNKLLKKESLIDPSTQ